MKGCFCGRAAGGKKSDLGPGHGVMGRLNGGNIGQDSGDGACLVIHI